MGRFINADAFASTGQGLLGNNMFAYCRNNPVRRVDISGTADVDCLDETDDIGLDHEEAGRPSGGDNGFDLQQTILDASNSASTILPRQGLARGDPHAPPVDAGKQGKHVPGHNNYKGDKSSWPTGQNGVQQTQEAWMNGVKDYRKPNQNVRIGIASDGTIVRVHMNMNGSIHGYPFCPYYTYIE